MFIIRGSQNKKIHHQRRIQMLKIAHVIGLLTKPQETWKKISNENNTVTGHLFGYVFILATIGPLAGYYGTTTHGWQIGTREAVKLSHESALTIAIMYYIMTIVAIIVLGVLVQWMAKTYKGECIIGRAISLAGYTATPIFLIGFAELYPVLWVNLLIGLPALAYTVYLLYSGVPIMMKVEDDKGFLMSSALLGLGMVALVSMMGAMAIAWGMGFHPEFTN